ERPARRRGAQDDAAHRAAPRRLLEVVVTVEAGAHEGEEPASLREDAGVGEHLSGRGVAEQPAPRGASDGGAVELHAVSRSARVTSRSSKGMRRSPTCW